MMPTSVPQRIAKRIFDFLLIFSLFVLPMLTFGQTAPKRSLITQSIDETKLTLLKGNTYPLARAEFDRGVAPLSLPMERMLLVLKRSPELEAALGTLLDEQQDKSSPNFHKWLTPEQFGQQFGPSDEDIQTVTGWLQSHCFQVAKVAKGRIVIEFSGTAAQVQEAFRTTIHKYVIDGAEHWANANDPQIPTALTPAVAGVFTLHNFYKATQHVVSEEQFTAKYTPGSAPQFTSTSGLHALMPADFATIYNLNPIYGAGVTGHAIIAVVGRTNINIQDIIDFRGLAGLPNNFPGIILNGPDPGDLGGGEEIEAVLDATWAGAVAPDATVRLVVSASTNSTDGVDLSEVYIVDNIFGNIMTESFGGCELARTQAQATAIASLAEQAAAEGITYTVSTGDNGAEGCDNPRSPLATHPLSVNILAATPFNVAVGGTQFTENGKDSTYWNTANNPTNLGSAKSYIPENVWNESCATNCGVKGPNLFAGSGGFSTFFTKPSWQSGVSGIPSDGARDLPDVSLSAAGHDPYLICIQRSCQPNAQGIIQFAGISGTSASAPAFAGIMALVVDETGSLQGQANYVLYRLAGQETLSMCNGSSQSGLPAASCIFNDVTIGNNAVPGEAGFGTPTGKYQAGAGYDLATGLGSVNVANLVNSWGNARSSKSNTTLNVNPATGGTHGSPINFTIGVAANSGTGTPSGDVALIAIPGNPSPVGSFTLSGGSVSSSTNQLPGGFYNLSAHYEGDGTFLPSDSALVAIGINPEKSTTTMAAFTGTPPNAIVPFSSGPYGTAIVFRGMTAGTSGVGTPGMFINITDNGANPLGLFNLDSTGTGFSLPITTLGAGPHAITGTYIGDLSFQASTSPPVNLTITQASTTTAIPQPPNPILVGQPNNLAIVVSTTGLGNGPTGTVTIFNGITQLGGPLPVIPGFAFGMVIGTADFQTSQLPAGPINLTAKYTGDTNYSASSSPATTINIFKQSVTTVMSSSPTVQQGMNLTLTAQVAPAQSGNPQPTGTVQFVGAGPQGPPVPLTNGQAVLVTNSLLPGIATITGSYSGDTVYAPSFGNVQVTVTPAPDFNVVPASQTITIASPGSSGSTTLTFTAMNGFSGTFNLSPAACSGLPSESSCSFSPASLTLNGTTTSGMTTLTVSTRAPSNVSPRFVQPPDGNIWLIIGIGAALTFFYLMSVPTRARRWNAVLGLLAFAALLTFAACGGGGGGGGGPHDPGTPIGVDPNVVVSISSGGVAHNIQLTVNVQ